jgi:hypothetical protein
MLRRLLSSSVELTPDIGIITELMLGANSYRLIKWPCYAGVLQVLRSYQGVQNETLLHP